ncbi:MAG: phosphate/phosphite/phosphonate ABC transporter substrate-binding protein [Planctomycetes bacterium]|nr:phosphate/phosphite/phosphonate ABC transporter substrate-binding protein [Planctomycetota bacterium]
MPRITLNRVVTLGALVLLGATGCRSGGIPLLNLFGLNKPLVVALLADQRPLSAQKPIELLNPFAPYEPLRKTLGLEIGRDVALDLCIPLQVEPSLSAGFYHLAIISPTVYGRMSDPQLFPVVAVTADAAGRIARPAVLVVAARSETQAVAELSGKTVAFGPRGDARTHLAGLRLLESHGVAKDNLSLEILPLPGSLKHMPDMRSVAQTVINGSSDAGFIDEAAWEAFPEHTEEAGEPARDKLRVIAQTVVIPDCLVVCSPKLAAETTDKVRAFLFAAHEQHPEVLRSLPYSAYREPTEAVLAACRGLAEPSEPHDQETE